MKEVYIIFCSRWSIMIQEEKEMTSSCSTFSLSSQAESTSVILFLLEVHVIFATGLYSSIMTCSNGGYAKTNCSNRIFS